MRRALRLALWPLLVPAALAAQSTVAVRTITEADVRRRIGIIADDSMLGRDTPSRGLDLTAQYVADEFKRLKLKPLGDSGSYLQRYPVERRLLLVDSSWVTVTDDSGHTATLSFASGAILFRGNAASRSVSGPVLLLGGRVDPTRLTPDAVKGRVVLWPMSFAKRPPTINQTINTIFRLGASAFVAMAEIDSERFAGMIGRQRAPRTARASTSGEEQLVVFAAADTLVRQLPAAGPLFAALRADTTMRTATGWQASLQLRDTLLERATAPNVVGLLEGTDPTLTREYVIYSAHMDHIGITPGAADSINNGADDDGSGTAGVVELAEAFAQKSARPKRSTIFLTVSGEEKGLWGSDWFATHPPVPLGDVVADLNIDMIGRNWTDTVAIVGLEHSNLADAVTAVERAHPELRMHGIRDPWPQENIYFRSDHYNFARRGVPILFFTSGLHPDYHRPSDSVEKIDAEKEARILRMLYWVGRAVGDATARPQWNPDSYRQIVTEPARVSAR